MGREDLVGISVQTSYDRCSDTTVDRRARCDSGGLALDAARKLERAEALRAVDGMIKNMSQAEIDAFFNEYVYGFIAGDVQREIDHARNGLPAGNFLCALALLCYTEVLGGVQRGTLARGEGRANFETFFAALGPAYVALQKGGLDAYSVFRCGMAHEYFVKGEATVAMLKGVEPAGIAQAPNGRFYFCVERYFEDFMAAARRLHAQIISGPRPGLPPELAGRV